MTDLDFFQFLDAALRVLTREQPQAFAAFCAQLAELELRVEVDGEARVLCVGRDQFDWAAADGGACLEVRSSRRALVALLDAETSLLDALFRDEFCLRGPAPTLARASDALLSLVRGGAKSPGVRRLLQLYLGEGVGAATPPVRRAAAANSREERP